MGYVQALEAASAKVIAYRKFGTYQGDWIAKVEFNGKVGWIRDYYGSCSGCDAFEAEFAYMYDEAADYPARLSEFGMKYLDNMLTFEEVIKVASENLEWGMDAAEMVNFINENE